jgi:hypothetical protein
MRTPPSLRGTFSLCLALPALLGAGTVIARAADLSRASTSDRSAPPAATATPKGRLSTSDRDDRTGKTRSATRLERDRLPLNPANGTAKATGHRIGCGGEFKTFAVPAGNAPAVVALLAKSFPPTTSRRITAISSDSILVYASPDDVDEIGKRMAAIDRTTGPATRRGARTLLVRQLVDPREQRKEKEQKEKNGKTAPPIIITAAGNKLLITSDDPEALVEIQRLAKLLTQTPGKEGDFQVIRLKNATATDAAKVLDEVFNGTKKQPPAQQQRGFFSRLAAAVAQPATQPEEERVRIVADPDTNALLVRASPLDMMTIRRLLDTAIDRADLNNAGGMRTWIIGPLNYSIASEVATVLTSVYREYTDNNPNLTNGVRRFPRGGLPNQNIGPDGQPRSVALTIGVDDRTNSLVVQCTKAMHDDVQKLVDRLEQEARQDRTTVEVMPVLGIDPSVVQEAIDAIQGRPTPTSTNRTGTTSMTSGGLGGLFRPSGGGMRPQTGGAGGFRPSTGGGGGFRPPGR